MTRKTPQARCATPSLALALAKGGGADAYAARADAKRALGRPIDEAIADYAQAAKLDPRYIEKWKGLIAQKESEQHPDSKSHAGSKGLNGVPISEIAAAGIAGALLIGAAVRMLRKREEHPLAPDDEAVKPGGDEKAAAPGTQTVDDEHPSKKEPSKTAESVPPAREPSKPA